MIHCAGSLALAVALAVCAGVWTGARAGDPAPEGREEPSKTEATGADKKEDPTTAGATRPEGGSEAKPEAVRVYTNADLERMFGPPSSLPEPSAEAAQDAAAGDRAIKRLEDELGRQKTLERRAVDVEGEVARAQAEVQRLEERIRRIRNPLLPRPELTAAEREEWAGLSNVERLKRTQTQLDEARKRLDAAQEALRALEAKTGGASASVRSP